MRVLDVAELTAYLKDLLESDPILGDVLVRGEISNFTRSAAGHLYFSLKAEGVQLRCVCFRGDARYLSFQPANGDAVVAHGHISLYEASGQYQLYVNVLVPEGTGLLQVQFEQLRQQLEREGLFEPSRKRPLPAFPRCIGVVTSASGAVWHDLQSVLSRRYPLCELILAPSLVAGAIYIAYGFLSNLWIIMILGTLEGAMIALLVPASDSYLADVMPANMRGRVQGMVTTTSTAMGFIGALICGPLYALGPLYLFLVLGGLHIITATTASVLMLPTERRLHGHKVQAAAAQARKDAPRVLAEAEAI